MSVEAPPINWAKFYELKGRVQRFLPQFDASETHRVKMVLRVMSGRPASALDVGCGDGYLCGVYAERLGVARVEGVDLAASHVARARENFPALTFNHGDVYRLPYGSDAFELVSAVEVLEHLENPARAFAELVRVSAREIVVTVPFNEPLAERLCPHCLKTFFLDGHIQRFDKHRLATLAREAGLRIREITVYRPWEERHVLRKIYSPVKRLLFPEDYESGGWVALSATKVPES